MTGADHIRRLMELRTLRAPLEKIWRDAYNFTYPLRGQKLGNEQASSAAVASGAVSKSAQIYDSTAKDSVRLLASALISGLTPANSRWFSLKINNISDNDLGTKEWLDGVADTLWHNIHASNYDVAAYEAFIDLAVSGMFAIYIEEGQANSGQPYAFKQWPLHSIFCADSTGYGSVDTVYRLFSLTAEQAVAEYGAKVSEQIQKSVDKKPDMLFEFVQCIYPRVKSKKTKLPIASDHIEVKSKQVVKTSGYEEMPVVVPRWLVIPDSVYSVGPIDDVLADIKTLNEVVRLILSNADLAIAGMWGAIDDGVLNPKSVTVGPRKVIAVANKDSFFPLTSGTKFDIGQMERAELQKSIRKIMMADQLQPQDGPAMTATEVHVRVQLIRQLLGPMYGRLQVEFLQPLITRCFGLAQRAGALLPAPASLAGKTAVPTYVSPLARAQKLEDVAAMDRFEQSLLVMAKDGITAPLDNYDVDAATRERAELLGVPPKLLRSEQDVQKLRGKKAAEAQAQQQQVQQHEMATAVAPHVAKGAMNAA